MNKVLYISRVINEQNLSHIYDTFYVYCTYYDVFKDKNTHYYSKIH